LPVIFIVFFFYTSCQGSHWTLDMASNNDAFLRSLGDLYRTNDPNVSFDHKQCRVQCFPHVVNTCVQHTLKALKNIDTTNNDSDEAEESASEAGDADEDLDGSEPEDGDPKESGGGSDVINKARGLIRTIRSSGQRIDRFNDIIKGGNQFGWWKDGAGQIISIKPRQLLRDVKTRWDSTYQMLIRLREFRQVSYLTSESPYH
jgi:hypothetical protein